MTTLENRQKIYQQIDQPLPDQLYLLAEFLDFLHFKGNKSATPFQLPSKRKAGLNPGAFIINDDFDDPLPDSFWLGEE